SLCASAAFAPATLLISVAGSLALAVIGRREPSPLTSGKVKLKMTQRAWRIERLAMLLFTVSELLCSAMALYWRGGMSTPCFWLAQLILLQSHPFWLVLANTILIPYEQRLQENFAEEARQLMRKYHPTVIGITGSYGKTSTKVLLKDILGSV